MIDTEPLTLDVRLTAKPIDGDAPPVCRMRRALKVLLRNYGIVAKWQDRPASTPSKPLDSAEGNGAGDDTSSPADTPAASGWPMRHALGHGDIPTDEARIPAGAAQPITAAPASTPTTAGEPGKGKPCYAS